MTENQQTPIRLSVSEAGRLFGVDQTTIRRAIKEQKLRYVVVQNRYKITFESLVQWSQQHLTVKNKTNNRGIGQFVEQWKIKTKKYSPNPAIIKTNPMAQKITPKTNTPNQPAQ
ncbi:helix-turn-helix domain-containing protein [Candidatus Falkowbacteria bacterium]|nr:helix-turn-helix domain-containing protein [Candidatus Falkowbacteria bacterium]